MLCFWSTWTIVILSSMEIRLPHSFLNWKGMCHQRSRSYSLVTLMPGRLVSQCSQPATSLPISLLRSLLSLLVPFQSLLGWTRRAKHLEVDCFPATHHSHHNSISSVLPGETECGETGRDDVFRGEESGGAGLSSTVWVTVVSMAAFCLPFHGHTAHVINASYYLKRLKSKA